MNAFIYDCEVTAYDWLFVFYDVTNSIYTDIHNDNDKLIDFINEHTNDIFVGFNNKNYDSFIVRAIMGGCEHYQVKLVNDWIIDGNRGWDCPELPKIKIQMNNVDLMDDTQTGTSLKGFEAHMGWDIVESSVDFNIDHPLSADELEEMIYYCRNDVKATYELYKIRADYLRTKGDIAEMCGLSVIDGLKMTNATLTAKYLKAHKQEWTDERAYEYPSNLKAEYIPQEVFAFFDRMHDDNISDDELFSSKMTLEVGGCPVTLGFGGIHGALPNYQDETTDDYIICNYDVASYYPHLMVINGYTSRSMENPQDYANMLMKRMAAKKMGDEKTNKALKLVCNTTYGAMLNQYNDLYDPKMGRSVCISGQLYLLSLAEELVSKIDGLKIIQLNTDGIMVGFNAGADEQVRQIIKAWENNTKFTLERDDIKRIVQKDVNNYIEIQTNGKVKSKGGYLVRGISKAGAFSINNNAPIIAKAILDYFVDGIPAEKTIMECSEIQQFQIIAKASHKYSAVFQEIDGEYIPVQRVNRIYATKDTTKGKLYKVKKGTDTKARISDLPEHCEIDNTTTGMTFDRLDFNYYLNVANKKIKEFVSKEKEMKKMTKEEKSEKLEATLKSLNVYQRLAVARGKLQKMEFAKTGRNTMGKGYMYYELEDLLPNITEVATKMGLFHAIYFTSDTAVIDVINTDKPEEMITFSVPLVIFEGNAGTNPVQGMGATITYFRKYLLLLAYDISEHDEIDEKNTLSTKETPTTTKVPKTPMQRAEIKNALTGGNATDLQKNQLMDAYKRIIELEPSYKDQINAKITETNGFANATKEELETYLKTAADMIAALEKKS